MAPRARRRSGCEAWRRCLPLLLLPLAGCGDAGDAADRRMLTGDPAKGRAVIGRVGCGACHVIPGISGARGTVGPTLDRFATRNFIAGIYSERTGGARPVGPGCAVARPADGDAATAGRRSGSPRRCRLPLSAAMRTGVRRAALMATAALLLLAGCSGEQSALDARGGQASAIAILSWVMFAGATLISLAVFATTVYAMAGPAERRARLCDRRLIIGAGIVFPTATLTALLVYSLLLADRMVEAVADEDPLRIEVVGEQWWWRVHYLDADGVRTLVTANEIRIPTGRTVEFVLTTADVIHSFWVPSLAGKVDMIPGHVNRLRLRADRPGLLRGQCAEYCGGAHALMAFYVQVEPDPAGERAGVHRIKPSADRVPAADVGEIGFIEISAIAGAIEIVVRRRAEDPRPRHDAGQVAGLCLGDADLRGDDHLRLSGDHPRHHAAGDRAQLPLAVLHRREGRRSAPVAAPVLVLRPSRGLHHLPPRRRLRLDDPADDGADALSRLPLRRAGSG